VLDVVREGLHETSEITVDLGRVVVVDERICRSDGCIKGLISHERITPPVRDSVKPLSYAPDMTTAPQPGERYRGTEGRIGFLLRQAQDAFATVMDHRLRAHGLTRPQFGVLSVVVADPGLSAADLARAAMVTPQAINLLVGGLEREGLLRREPHPAHGRVLQLFPTTEGARRVADAYPTVIELEEQIVEGLSARQVMAIKRWLVSVATTLRD
jgi:DNA-binding MarR family transcriptional regulator